MDTRNTDYFDTLPEGYREIPLYDANSAGFKLLTGPVSFVTSLLIAAFLFFSKIGFSFRALDLAWRPLYLLHILTVLVLVLIYTTLHELTHGLVYKLLTHRKLSFGLSGSFAYCGLPGVYVRRNIAAASCIAPFVVFTALYAVLLWALPVSPFWFALLVSFMNHLGGCFADLFAFVVMMRSGSDLLLLDSGKEQHAYIKAD